MYFGIFFVIYDEYFHVYCMLYWDWKTFLLVTIMNYAK